MRRTKTMLMGDLLEEFSNAPTSPRKSPKANCRTHGARLSATAPRMSPPNCGSKSTSCTYAYSRASCARNFFYQREALKEEINRRSGVRLVNAVIIR